MHHAQDIDAQRLFINEEQHEVRPDPHSPSAVPRERRRERVCAGRTLQSLHRIVNSADVAGRVEKVGARDERTDISKVLKDLLSKLQTP